MTKVLLSWSSGKDSAWALHLLRARPDVEVVGLLTTFNGMAERVAMHAVRRTLVGAQAERVGLPLWSYDLPSPCTNAEYEEVLGGVFARSREEGVEAIAYGDLFLQDIREYRERQMSGSELTAMFSGLGIADEGTGTGDDRGGGEGEGDVCRSGEARCLLCGAGV